VALHANFELFNGKFTKSYSNELHKIFIQVDKNKNCRKNSFLNCLLYYLGFQYLYFY
jgi:hypothetical protein